MSLCIQKINGDLYWLLSIIPNDAAGIAKTVLLDAKTNKVTGFDNVEALNTCISTGTVSTAATVATPSQPSATASADSTQIKAKIDEIQTQLDTLKAMVK